MLLKILVVICVIFFTSRIWANRLFPFQYRYCTPITEYTKIWKATVNLTQPLYKIQGTEQQHITHISVENRYMELIGQTDKDSSEVCVSFEGTYSSAVPEVVVSIKPLVNTAELLTREIRSLRVIRATEIWYVSSVPTTTNRQTLLKAFAPYYRQWGDDSLSGTTRHSSSASLTVHYAKGSYSQSSSTRGAGFFTTPSGLPSNVDDLILRYDIYFDNFGFGRMGKLPGLYGGVTGDGSYQCSGGTNPSTCFSLRLMWRSGGDGELYAYLPSNQEAGFHDRPDVIANPDHGQSIGRGKIKFQSGTWQTVTQQVHLNAVGKTDGWVKFCNQIRGQSQQCYTASNLRMRNSSGHHLRGLFFSTFFGGSQPADGAPNDCHTFYKEFRIQIPEGVVVG